MSVAAIDGVEGIERWGATARVASVFGSAGGVGWGWGGLLTVIGASAFKTSLAEW